MLLPPPPAPPPPAPPSPPPPLPAPRLPLRGLLLPKIQRLRLIGIQRNIMWCYLFPSAYALSVYRQNSCLDKHYCVYYICNVHYSEHNCQMSIKQDCISTTCRLFIANLHCSCRLSLNQRKLFIAITSLGSYQELGRATCMLES